ENIFYNLSPFIKIYKFLLQNKNELFSYVYVDEDLYSIEIRDIDTLAEKFINMKKFYLEGCENSLENIKKSFNFNFFYEKDSEFVRYLIRSELDSPQILLCHFKDGSGFQTLKKLFDRFGREKFSK